MANEAAASGGVSCVGVADEFGPSSGGSSPKSRMKFLCSYGGKILPRAADGHLKYVGGETRVIAVPRDISFSELMKKLSSEFEGDMVLKYQLIPEDLEVLVSVRNNDDMKHMLDEYDRHENEGAAKLRAFMFPSNPVILENQNIPADPQAIEQHYIDAINNTVHSFSNFRLPLVNVNRSSFSLSACSSPKGNSPDGITVDSVTHEPTFMNSYHNHSTRFPMHKVHSSPSLYNLNTHHHQTNNNYSNHHFYQHHHQYYQHHQQHHPHGYQSSRLANEPYRLTPSFSYGRLDIGRYHSNVQSVGNSNVHNMVSGNSS
ncbi:hypothetical protein P3X46_024549 [Hevea brasiliensis]|uniref:PB1 domain-containing protein n=1 Tax=Hevea brasiliensis TaxID=3981 RepID=A0ABQ9L629_HEVBR|nr:uncharacterized protein LOC110666531 [Hevea brasiliensis]XP_057991795.1 uncharacterized protein LOC110666531 [Hevea brasiliensis]KAJ9159014.1 hypothetical protein P3X46_024549 [Hevea brasiliensis]